MLLVWAHCKFDGPRRPSECDRLHILQVQCAFAAMSCSGIIPDSSVALKCRDGGLYWMLACGLELNMPYTAPRASIRTGGKGPPSAPPTVPPIIINPFRYEKPAPAIDPRVDMPGPPLRAPWQPSMKM